MAEKSEIAWTDSTFNGWIGCTKVSPACDHCYAESLSKRWMGVKWGPGEERRRTTASNWRKPVKWNREAEATGVRRRVFCASLADVFDAEVPEHWFTDLLKLIDDTPHLDWQLLTKRPKIARKRMPDQPRANIWLGTTVENQEMAAVRIPHVLETPAVIRFLSMEPLLGPVDLFRVNSGQFHFNALSKKEGLAYRTTGIDWVICGGESGHGARTMPVEWAKGIQQQCATAWVPFFMKQLSQADSRTYGQFDAFPGDLQVREFPVTQTQVSACPL